jgi:hypothetical protein
MDNIDLNKKLLNIIEASIEEGRMKDVIQDAMDMSKQEFEAQYGDSFDYDQLVKDYGPDAQSESFDPAMEPNHYDTEFERIYAAYENGGEPELAEFLGMSDRELDQEMTEYAMDHNLHMDDDRDTVIQGYIEDVIDNADHKDHGGYESVEEDEVEVDELAMPCGAEVEPEQLEGSVEFKQHKNTEKGSVSIEASADNMQELSKVLKLAGLTLPKDMNADQDPMQPAEEPEVVVPDEDDGNQPTMNFPKTDVDPNMSQDKAVLTSVIRDKLRDYLKNSQR